MMLLSWLAFAKRPLKTHEIQALKSINIAQRNVDFEHRSFRVDLKDLCESLIDIGEDQTVDLVHLTAKR
jgi:hypothetical protein